MIVTKARGRALLRLTARSQRRDAKALYRRIKRSTPSHLPENRSGPAR